MKRIYNYLKKDAVLTISWVLAIVSMFFIKPDKAYAGYIDWRSLGILWSLMIITKGYMQNGIFEKIGHALLTRTRKMWQLIAVLVGLNFFSSMIITNDVSLITFVPFAIRKAFDTGDRITDDCSKFRKYAHTDWQSAESVSVWTGWNRNRRIHNVAAAIHNSFSPASGYINPSYKE